MSDLVTTLASCKLSSWVPQLQMPFVARQSAKPMRRDSGAQLASRARQTLHSRAGRCSLADPASKSPWPTPPRQPGKSVARQPTRSLRNRRSANGHHVDTVVANVPVRGAKIGGAAVDSVGVAVGVTGQQVAGGSRSGEPENAGIGRHLRIRRCSASRGSRGSPRAFHPSSRRWPAHPSRPAVRRRRAEVRVVHPARLGDVRRGRVRGRARGGPSRRARWSVHGNPSGTRRENSEQGRGRTCPA